MKAYEVFYQTDFEEKSMIVLCENVSNLEEAVFKKDKDFVISHSFSNIISKKEIPLSNVMVSDLSVTELLALIKNKL